MCPILLLDINLRRAELLTVELSYGMADKPMYEIILRDI